MFYSELFVFCWSLFLVQPPRDRDDDCSTCAPSPGFSSGGVGAMPCSSMFYVLYIPFGKHILNSKTYGIHGILYAFYMYSICFSKSPLDCLRMKPSLWLKVVGISPTSYDYVDKRSGNTMGDMVDFFMLINHIPYFLLI